MMAKTFKTNNVQELLKAKGVSTTKKKASESKVVPRETSRKRLYDLVSEDLDETPVLNTPQHEEPLANVNMVQNRALNKVDNIVTKVEQNGIPNIEPNKALNIEQSTIQNMEHIEAPNIEQNQAPNIVQIKAQNIEPNKELNEAQEIAGATRAGSEELNKGLNQVQNKIPNQVPIKVLNEALNIEPKAVPSLVPGTTTFETTFRNMFQVPTKIPGLSELKILFLFKQILDATGQIVAQKKQIEQVLNIKLETIKTSITRLKTKGYIKLKEYADGRSVGYSIFELTDKASEVLASPKALAALEGSAQSASKNVGPDHGSSLSSSSSINKTTTTENRNIIFSIPNSFDPRIKSEEFLKYLGKLRAEQIQDSIDDFGFDLEHDNVKAKSKNPYDMLHGILKNGDVYKSYMRFEVTKKSIEENKKRILESEQLEAEMRAEQRREKFKEWKQGNPAAYQDLLSDADPVVKGRESLADAHVMKKWDENKC